MKKIVYFILAVSTCFGESIQDSSGKEKSGIFDFSFLTDLCWNCFGPIHIAGYKWSSQEDFIKYKKKSGLSLLCMCGMTEFLGFIPIPDQIGVPIAFWEPQAIIEVTRIPNRSLTLIHTSGDTTSYEKMGSISNSDAGRSSFYNVHYYPFPLARTAMFVPGLKCLRNAELSMVPFRTEWFPFWNDMDHSLHVVLDPIRYLYSSPELQELCKKDCEAANKRKPSDSYPWCAGCLGSLYPFSGHIGYHIGGIQASSLLVCRTLGMLHAAGLFLGADTPLNVLGLGKGFEPDNYCEKTYSYNLKKTIYKTQLIYPKADKGYVKDGVEVYCHPLGESDSSWGAGSIWPDDGEDFTYIVWTKMHCCLDATEPFKKAFEAIKNLFDGVKKPDKKTKETFGKNEKEFEELMQKAEELIKGKIQQQGAQ
jgi:conjugal transfer pilus assembly protein TraU